MVLYECFAHERVLAARAITFFRKHFLGLVIRSFYLLLRYFCLSEPVGNLVLYDGGDDESEHPLITHGFIVFDKVIHLQGEFPGTT